MHNEEQIELNLGLNSAKKDYLYFDTETTDLDNKELIQFAFITDKDLKFNMYFKPKGEISFKAMAVHNITPEMLADKPAFEIAEVPEDMKDADFHGTLVSDYLKFLADKYIWVAHNSAFDSEVLKNVGIKIPKVICTYKLSRELLSQNQEDLQDLESYALQFLRYFLGLYKKETNLTLTAHDALSDVYFLRDLFHYIKENFKKTDEEMMNITKAFPIMRNIAVGKHAGKSIKQINEEDPEYLQWILDTWTDKPELLWNIQRILAS